jgi:hypothetical protein
MSPVGIRQQRSVLGAVAAAIPAGLAAAVPALQAPGYVLPLLSLGGLGVLLLLLGALRVLPPLLPWGVGVLAATYVVSLTVASIAAAPLALLEGAALFAAAEAAWLVADPDGTGLWAGLGLRLVGILAGGVALGWLALFGGALPLPGGPFETALGVVAAAAAFALLRRLSRRPAAPGATSRSEPRSP